MQNYRMRKIADLRPSLFAPLLTALSLLTSVAATASGSTAVVDSSQLFSLSLEELAKIKVAIATGTEQSLDLAPAVTSVITARDITALGARTLDEVLETVPGLHVSLSSVNRLDAVYSIRGIHTGFNPHVILMLDGNPVQWSLLGGRPFLYRLPTAHIARIEVIRGPNSAIYGSDAFSGVINVITRSGDDIKATEVGARAGSFNNRDAWLNASKRLNDWMLTANLAYMSSNGDDSRVVDADLQTLLDTGFGTSASLAPGALATDYGVYDIHLKAENRHWQLGLWSWRSSDTGNGAGGAQALDPTTKETFSSHFLDIRYQFDSLAGWEQTAKLTYFYHDVEGNLTLLPANTVAPIGADGNLDFVSPAGVTLFTEGVIGQPSGTTEDWFFETIGQKTLAETHAIRVAAGVRHQTLDTREKKNFGPGILDGTQSVVDGTLTDVSNTQYVFAPDTDRDIAHLSLQDQWQFADNWTFTGGVRFDHYSDFGNTLNPRLALVWETSDTLTSKLLYGSAFRAPSFAELLYINNPAALGNPDLEPETINTLELVLNYRPLTNLQTSFNLYHYQAEKMIEFVPGPTGAVAQNARDQDGEGFELEVKWQPVDTLMLSLNGAWQTSYDPHTKVDIADAPRRQLGAILNWTPRPNWLLNLNASYIGGRQRAATDLRPAVANYTLYDFHVKRIQLLPHLDVSLKVKNLGDTDAREPSSGTIPDDYPLESRSYWVDASYQF